MVASGILCIVLGISCTGLGLVFKKQAPPPPKEKKQKKGKGKKGKKSSTSDKQRPPKGNTEGRSLVWGGLGLTLLGIAFLVYGLMK